MSAITFIFVYNFLNGDTMLFFSEFNAGNLGVLMLSTIVFVSNTALLYSYTFMDQEYRNESITLKKLQLFYILTYLFIASMILVTISGNLALSWLGIELSTLSSAFLVGYYTKKTSLEAAWKYFIINTIGVTVALLGILFLVFATAKNMPGETSLSFAELLKNAASMNPQMVKIAFVLLLVGFGTKVGLVPMHTWLPDAHSKAVTPVSGILSSILLPTALLIILKVKSIVDVTLGSSNFTSSLLIVFGVMSVAMAGFMILIQQNYKRLLAYSSIEHMGIMAILFALNTPLAIMFACYHYVFHALIKSSLFFLSGNIYMVYHSTKIAKVKAVLKRIPMTGFIFLAMAFAITGIPPFGIFTTKLGMLEQIVGLISGKAAINLFGLSINPVIGTIIFIILLLSLVLISIGFVMAVMRLLLKRENEHVEKVADNFWGNMVILVSIAVLMLVSFDMIPFVKDLIMNFVTNRI